MKIRTILSTILLLGIIVAWLWVSAVTGWGKIFWFGWGIIGAIIFWGVLIIQLRKEIG